MKESIGLAFLIWFLLVTSAHAIFFPTQDVQVSCEAACSHEIEVILIAANASSQTDPYTEAEKTTRKMK